MSDVVNMVCGEFPKNSLMDLGLYGLKKDPPGYQSSALTSLKLTSNSKT